MTEDSELKKLRKEVQNFIERRDWEDYHDPKNLSMSITVEASELMEMLQWKTNEEAKELLKDDEKFDSAVEELADILIYCLSLANQLDVDVAEIIKNKIDKNKSKYPQEKSKGEFKKYTELEKD